ncbi:MAG TPA: hypothetical protein VD908_12940 [Cytophagales bacterium]|nr:hypothetical protein [Cytophagales bacterium]
MVMTYIRDFIEKKSADDIVVEGSKLTFKSKFFKAGRWNTNILVPIEKGEFNIVKKGDKTFLTYEFFMYHLFIGTLLIALFFSAISGHIWIGLFFFIWLCGMNWITAIFRHKSMHKKITLEIDKLTIN